MIFKWKDGSHFPVDAQVAGERIEAIRDEAGVVTAPLVLEDARAEDSPLHRCFEWDDSIAAEKHRLHQTRYLLERIVTTVTVDGGVPTETRAYVATRVEEMTQHDFRPVAAVMADADSRKQFVQTALTELARWEAKYAHVPELAATVAAVRAARQAKKVRRTTTAR